MSPRARLALAALTVATAVAFSLVMPWWADSGPATETLTSDRDIPLTAGSVTLPSGWELDIASTSLGATRATQGDVVLRVSDAIWFGTSSSLLARVASIVGLPAHSVPPLSEEEDAASVFSRDLEDGFDPGAAAERYAWDLRGVVNDPAGDRLAHVTVVRQDISVAIVIGSGPPDQVERLADDIAATATSVEIDSVGVDLDTAARRGLAASFAEVAP